MIPARAVEAARKVAFERYGTKPDAAYLRTILEAAAPHMLARDESKLAAIIVALDPFERVTKWMATDDEAGIYAIEAVSKIRAILDTP